MTAYQTLERGSKYAVEITLPSGMSRRILVKKTERLNPSVRGGAYKTEWHAYNGGMNLSVRADTREAAYLLAMKTLTKRFGEF